MGSLNAGRGAMTWHTHHPELGDPAHSNGGDYRSLPLVPYDLPEMTVEESADFQIRQAMRIGIDGFAINAWAGGHEAREFLDALFRVAERNDYPFEISICPDPNTVEQPEGLTRAWADAIKYLLDRHGDSPKLARRDGKPIIFGYQSVFVWVEYLEKKYNYDRERIDLARTTPEGWALVGEAYRELEEMVGQPLYFQFDMGAFYHGLETREEPRDGKSKAAAVVAQHMPALCEFLPSNETDAIAAAATAASAEWGQPIFLNYDNPRLPATYGGPGTDTLRELWQAARESNATLLQLTTWNDYHENTNIAPGITTNYAYFDLTGYFIEWWKKGSPPEYDRDKVYLFARKYPRWAPMFPFQDYRNSDGVVEALTILTKPARIRLPGRGEYDVPAGLHFQQFPVTPGEVKAELIRNGKVELVVESAERITDRPFRQDNGITGISSEFSYHWRQDFGSLPEYHYSEYGDIDGDGLPNWFEMLWFGHFGDLSTATSALPHEDVNGDGYSNLEAYLQQRNPVAPPSWSEPKVSEPFTGSPLSIPGRIEAEFYDKGGQGVAYFDTTDFNQGGAFRQDEKVDIEATSDAGGGYNLGWVESSEWLKYTVDVEASGYYDLHFRVARMNAGSGRLTLFFDDKLAAGSVELPSTGGWQTWETVVVPAVRLKAGVQTMRLAIEEGFFNLNYIDFVPGQGEPEPGVTILSPNDGTRFRSDETIEILAAAEGRNDFVRVEYFAGDEKVGKVEVEPYLVSTRNLPSGVHYLTAKAYDRNGIGIESEPVRIEVYEGRVPFHGSPAELPGRVWAKEFDYGGEGVAYHDTTPENEGGAFRPNEGVDLEPTDDIEGDFNLGWTAPGEWILYTVDVMRSGVFEIGLRVAAVGDQGRFRLEFDDAEPIVVQAPKTGGWQNWETVTISGVALKAGWQTMRLVVERGDFNLNYIDVQSIGISPPQSFEGWIEANFGSSERGDDAHARATADASGNGIPNLLAYALDLDPFATSREGLPEVGTIDVDGETYLTLTYKRPIGINDIAYHVEVSSDLVDWESGDDQTVPVSVTRESGLETVVVRDRQPLRALTTRQIRLRVERIDQ
ncbi:MAG TPA: endo-1,3-alpha-glucanase family glycosylhydrolase [Opitutales bacterium]|nr:endo-1,3-alpha-glucanase family glycosylhydrolase [Opitutales bacterium]